MRHEKLNNEHQAYKNLVEKIYEREEQTPNDVYLVQPIRGKWHEYTWKQVVDQARRLVSFFKAQGLKKGDNVSILSKNCAHWYIADFAISMAGLVNVPLYPMQHPKKTQFILKEAKVKYLFTGKIDDWPSQQTGISSSVKIINFPYDPSIQADFQWDDIIEQYPPDPGKCLPEPEDIFSIIYTSGTGGNPKGVVMNYANQSGAAIAICLVMKERFNITKKIKAVSYLPLAHILERAFQTTSPYFDCKIYFVESLETFADTLRKVSPNIFFGVPRIWNVFREKVLQKLPQDKLDRLLKIPLLSSLIKKKIRKKMGLDNAICASGSAPIAVSTIEWFDKLGIIIYEGYGSTENYAGSCLNYPGGRKIGAVGRPMFGYEYKLGENNELLCRSPMNMQGYYLNDDQTQEVMDNDGYYHTGDIGDIDQDGFVWVKGRLSDTMKTDKGEFLIPVPIENTLHHVPYFGQLCLIGHLLAQPILITHLNDQAKNEPRDKLRKELEKILENTNKNLAKHEKISHIMITNDDWSIENEILTPTFKVKRNIITDKFHDRAEKLQHQEKGVYWEDEIS